MSKFYSKEEEFKEVLKSGESPEKLIYKEYIPEETRAIDEQKLTVDFTISSSSIDRMHDVIEQDGWELKAFKKNPVVLWAHDQSQPPVAKAISKSLKVEGKRLIATAQFMPADVSEFSYMIFQMYKLGFMNATSVGFRPLEWSFAEDDKRPYGVNFTKQELLEFSCVPVPANSDALMSAKSMGVNTRPLKAWVEQTLDNWKEEGGLMVPRSNIEELHKSLTARVKLLKPIEEIMTEKTEITEEVKEVVKEVVIEEKVAEAVIETKEADAELVSKIREAHAMHRCAMNLARQASSIHKKGCELLTQAFDPDGPQDGDGTDYADGKALLDAITKIAPSFALENTFDAKTEIKSLETQIAELTELVKTLIVKPELQEEVKEEVKEVVAKEVVVEKSSDEFLIIFEDSVDKSEDSVNLEEVKELLLSLDLGGMVEEALTKRLGSKV